MTTDMQNAKVKRLFFLALLLAIFTIVYNIAEGVFSTFFGANDETLTLFGFGIDSFVEVASGLGIAHMISRIRRAHTETRLDKFEKQALRITGVGFLVLTGGLVIGACLSIIFQQKPVSTLAGLIISLASILSMGFLYLAKIKVGKSLDSAPIIADAECTLTCFYLSFILLASSLIYMFFKIPYIDAIGSLGIAWFSFREGREALEKARSGNPQCCCSGEGHECSSDEEEKKQE